MTTRRGFLRGLGGSALALPWMESLGSQTLASGVSKRMAHFYVPIGVVRRGFFPGEADSVIPKGNLGNVMKYLGFCCAMQVGGVHTLKILQNACQTF